MTATPPFQSAPLELLVEVPRGSFVKRDATGRIEFISPLPCPFNYGSLPGHSAADGDALDAALLGPRRVAGQRLHVPARAVIRFLDAGQEDDKLICAVMPLTLLDRGLVLGFFHFYALCKRAMNAVRGRRGMTRCLGWGDPDATLARAPRI